MNACMYISQFNFSLLQTISLDMDQNFIFMNNQKIFKTSAVSGSLIGVVIAFIVILISTRKFHIAFFATTTILCVLVSVIGFLSMMGWVSGIALTIMPNVIIHKSV